jgi:hypothetical protein
MEGITEAVGKGFRRYPICADKWIIRRDTIGGPDAQVVKQRHKGRVIRVSYRVIYGSLERVQAVLNQTGIGQLINTASVERFNLTLRQHLPAPGRKVISLEQLLLFRVPPWPQAAAKLS